jgi:hypothetical protein
MSKKLPQPEPKGFRPDPHRQHPPIDRKIQLPEPVRRAAARADALLTGKPFERAPQRNRTFSYSDTEIVEAMQYLDREGLQAGDPRVATIIALAREGAQHIKARRRGAHEPRENSENVTQRLGALLQAYRELSPTFKRDQPARQRSAFCVQQWSKNSAKRIPTTQSPKTLSDRISGWCVRTCD